ncbi:MAG: hypothetical protein ACYCYL_05110 [Acidithiobacillus sp.]|jgi:Flp pilus assembly pilin Flp
MRILMRLRRFSGRSSQQGQAMVEYIIVLIFAIIVLVSISAGSPSPIDQLATALKTYWQNYSYIISLP